ncbi:hypothetical protein F3I58_17985 [Pantoea sp. VH_4]|uniref:Uncharacterized protein n=1 Tax=Candidatus Pantoea gossypiicola TaxID=2608008 RepID=A0AB34CDX9_9GAMM|nr:hypothetical protein F3I59_17910 [Pantoea sp. VH_8]KAA5931162.1 hypothetical protein F3I58_17985 [Pantoea sp. VH_4]KAA5982747.1 hypothetical protein F3I49_17440 [Pantoea sp. M_4]KAA6120688.1 hypothetical protein F3I20_19565 [Pantoea gossypiicola]
MREKPAGIWCNPLNFRATSHFIPRIRQADRNKIPCDPCALMRTPYNSPPDIVPSGAKSGLSGL